MSCRAAYEQLRARRIAINERDAAEQEMFLAHWHAASLRAAAAMREEGERIIAGSRPSIQPRLREVLSDIQRDYDDEREFGWSLDGATEGA